MPMTPVERHQRAMGFVHASQRQACRNCRHAIEINPTGASNDCWALRCHKHGFGVTALSICDWHERKPVGGGA
jgi:hypothetical protein